MGLFDIFFKDKTTLKLTLPKGLRVEHFDKKIKLIGTKDEISSFVQELRKVSRLNDGQLAKLNKYVLKVSDYMTEDRFRSDWIELPGRGWGVMASKFSEVVDGREDNPFYFNSCGYTDKLPLDIGVEVTDLADE
jgi:hypothetical protein